MGPLTIELTNADGAGGIACENRVSSTIPVSEDQSHLHAQGPASTISAPVQSDDEDPCSSSEQKIHHMLYGYQPTLFCQGYNLEYGLDLFKAEFTAIVSSI
jgi:hypothetical protein